MDLLPSSLSFLVRIEKKLACGQVEELIEEAQDELTLISKMIAPFFILKGVMEARNDKVWERFTIECGKMDMAGYELGCYVGNALLAMYCKCGSVEETHDIFEGTAEKDVVSWNTMIVGYARHGFGKQTLEVFELMKIKGIKPDDVTMVGVLSACSHAGLVSEGMECFHSMDKKYGIKAKANQKQTTTLA